MGKNISHATKKGITDEKVDSVNEQLPHGMQGIKEFRIFRTLPLQPFTFLKREASQ